MVEVTRWKNTEIFDEAMAYVTHITKSLPKIESQIPTRRSPCDSKLVVWRSETAGIFILLNTGLVWRIT